MIYGESSLLDEFERHFEMLINYLNKYNKIDENAIFQIFSNQMNTEKQSKKMENILMQQLYQKKKLEANPQVLLIMLLRFIFQQTQDKLLINKHMNIFKKKNGKVFK